MIFRVAGMRRGAAGLHDPAGHALRRHLLRAGARAPARPAADRLRTEVREYVRHAGGALGGRAREEGEGRRLHRPLRGQPRQRRGDPDLGRRLRADGLRHRRDHGRARPRRARPRVRRAVRAEIRHGRRAGRRARPSEGRHSSPTPTTRCSSTRASSRAAEPRRPSRRSWSGSPSAARRGDDRLPPARLAALAPALLGRPIPIVHCGDAAWCRCPTTSCRSCCPEVEEYLPKGRSPLAAAEEWVNVDCPRCGGPASRETDTMDTFVDSSWYFIRYIDPRNDKRAVRRARSPTAGCRSTSTSAASSTRSCTCSTRASSRR